VRPDRIASRSAQTLQGQLVSSGRQPQTGARVFFVSADRSAAQQTATTDGAGRFGADLSSGDWLVYVQQGAGRPVFHQKVRVPGGEPVQMTLVGR
jgi:hypothetical protein